MHSKKSTEIKSKYFYCEDSCRVCFITLDNCSLTCSVRKLKKCPIRKKEIVTNDNEEVLQVKTRTRKVKAVRPVQKKKGVRSGGKDIKPNRTVKRKDGGRGKTKVHNKGRGRSTTKPRMGKEGENK